MFNSNIVRFPLWSYLNQPLFERSSATLLNPRRYWNRHQILHLERCWDSAFQPKKKSKPSEP